MLIVAPTPAPAPRSPIVPDLAESSCPDGPRSRSTVGSSEKIAWVPFPWMSSSRSWPCAPPRGPLARGGRRPGDVVEEGRTLCPDRAAGDARRREPVHRRCPPCRPRRLDRKHSPARRQWPPRTRRARSGGPPGFPRHRRLGRPSPPPGPTYSGVPMASSCSPAAGRGAALRPACAELADPQPRLPQATVRRRCSPRARAARASPPASRYPAALPVSRPAGFLGEAPNRSTGRSGPPAFPPIVTGCRAGSPPPLSDHAEDASPVNAVPIADSCWVFHVGTGMPLFWNDRRRECHLDPVGFGNLRSDELVDRQIAEHRLVAHVPEVADRALHLEEMVHEQMPENRDSSPTSGSSSSRSESLRCGRREVVVDGGQRHGLLEIVADHREVTVERKRELLDAGSERLEACVLPFHRFEQ